MATLDAPPPLLGTWLAPTYGRQPPGMTWEDWQPWQRWLAGPGAQWSAYTYDVPLYTGGELLPAVDPRLAEMWARNNAKRIDAIGYRDGALDLFEARRFAGWSAIGQLLGYADLWLFNMPLFNLARLYLITERCDDAIRALAARHQITTWCIDEPLPT